MFATLAYARKQKALKITGTFRALGLAYLVEPGGFDLSVSEGSIPRVSADF
jgi:hypothetical protein